MRNNRFLEANEDFLSLLDDENQETNTITTDIVKQSEDIRTLSPNEFKNYDDHNLKLDLHSGEAKDRLVESIERNGIMQPIIVDENMMILSGHNRVQIAKELGIDVPYIVKSGLTKEEKELIVIDTNLLNRQLSEYKPSQLAYVLAIKMEAEKHQGTSLHGETKLTGDKIGEEYGLSRTQIFRYVKLNSLTDYAKELMDSKLITMRMAYELTRFSPAIQDFLLNNRKQYNVTDKILKQIWDNSRNVELNTDDEWLLFVKEQLVNLCFETKRKHAIDYRNLKKYIPENVKSNEVEAYIIKALQAYGKE